MSERPQVYLTTPEQVGILALGAEFFDSIPVEGESQYDDYFSFMAETIPMISEVVVEACGGIVFIPYVDTKQWFFADLQESSKFIAVRWGTRLYLEDWILEATTITWNGTELDEYDSGTGEGYWLAMPRRDYPYDRIDFRRDLPSSVPVTGGFGRSIDINGFWGFHRSANQLYVDVAADNAVSLADTTTTTLEVSNADAYRTYQYIRLEDELLLVTARDTDADPDELTVTRGENGSTAAAHTGVQVQQIFPMRNIQDVAAYMARYAYANRNELSDAIQVGDLGVIIPKMPERYQRTLTIYRDIAEQQLMGAF